MYIYLYLYLYPSIKVATLPTQVVAVVERRQTASFPGDGRQAINVYDKPYTYMTSYMRI